MDIIDVEINMAEVVKQIAASTKAANALKEQIRELSNSEDDNTEAIARLRVELAAENADKRKAENLAKNMVLANKAEAGSVDELGAQLVIVTDEWRKLSEEERENTEAGRNLVETKKNLTEQLKAVEKQTGDTRRNVGNYKEDIIEAYEATDGFGGALGGLPGALGSVGTAMKVLAGNPLVAVLTIIVSGMTALVAAMSKTQEGADRLAKVSAVVGAVFDTLVGTVGELANDIVDAFESPAKSLEKFGGLVKEFVTDKIKAVVDIFGLAGEAIGLFFEGKFSESAKKAGEAADVFVDKLYPVTGLVRAFGAAVDVVADKAESAAKSALALTNAEIALEKQQARSATAVAKANVELQKQIELRDADTKTLESRYEAGEKVLEQTEKFYDEQIKLAKAEKLVADTRLAVGQSTGLAKRAEITAVAEANAKIIALEGERQAAIIKAQQELQLIKQDAIEQDLDVLINFTATQTGIIRAQADDERKSFAERAGLIEKAKGLNRSAFEAQINSLDELAGKRQDIAKLAEITDAETFNAELKKLELSEIGRQRVLEAIPAYQQAVQDLADAEVAIQTEKSDALKEAEAQRLADSYEAQRANLFAEFDLQRSQLAAKEKAETESAEKIGTSTSEIAAKYAAARKAIDGAEFNAKLNLAKGFAGNLAQIFGEQTAVGKAAAIAQTTIATYQSATESYKSLSGIPIVGPALGFAAAAAAVVAGIGNVKKILAVKSGLPGDSVKGGSVPGATASAAAPSVGISAQAGIGQGIVSRNTLQPSAPQNAQVAVVVDSVTASQNRQSYISEVATV